VSANPPALPGDRGTMGHSCGVTASRCPPGHQGPERGVGPAGSMPR